MLGSNRVASGIPFKFTFPCVIAAHSAKYRSSTLVSLSFPISMSSPPPNPMMETITWYKATEWTKTLEGIGTSIQSPRFFVQLFPSSCRILRLEVSGQHRCWRCKVSGLNKARTSSWSLVQSYLSVHVLKLPASAMHSHQCSQGNCALLQYAHLVI